MARLRWTMELEIRLLGGSWERRRVVRELDGPGLARVLLGSDELCDLRIGTDQIDAIHLAIVLSGDELLLEDLGSRRGTRIGRRVLPPGRTPIPPGTVFYPGGVGVRVVRSLVEEGGERRERRAPPPAPKPPVAAPIAADDGGGLDGATEAMVVVGGPATQSATGSGPAARTPGGKGAATLPAEVQVELDVEVRDATGRRRVALRRPLPSVGGSATWSVGAGADDDIPVADELGDRRLRLSWSTSGLVWVSAEGEDTSAWTAEGSALSSAVALDGAGEVHAGPITLVVHGWRLDQGPPAGFDLAPEDVGYVDDRGLGSFFPEHTGRLVVPEARSGTSRAVPDEGSESEVPADPPTVSDPTPPGTLADAAEDASAAPPPPGSRWLLTVRVSAPGAAVAAAQVDRPLGLGGRASVVVGSLPRCDIVVKGEGVRGEHLSLLFRNGQLWAQPLGVLEGPGRARFPVVLGQPIAVGPASLVVLQSELRPPATPAS